MFALHQKSGKSQVLSFYIPAWGADKLRDATSIAKPHVWVSNQGVYNDLRMRLRMSFNIYSVTFTRLGNLYST